MLSLVYLTSVAGLIATSAVLHQLSLSRSVQPPLSAVTQPGLTQTHLYTSTLTPEAPAAAHRPPCCVLANKSLNRQNAALGTGAGHRQTPPPAAPSHTSVLCLWGSLLASMGHIHPESDSEADSWSAASFFCPGCLATLPPLQCGLKNASTLVAHAPAGGRQHRAPWLAGSSLLGATEPGLNSHLGAFPPVQLGPCHPESMKAQALLMPG